VKYVLGLNAFHGDSSACVLESGILIAAAEEERFRRVKHWAGFPTEAIQYCLNEAGIQLQDVAVVAINSDPNANLARKVKYALRSRPSFKLLADRIRNRGEREGIASQLSAAFPDQEFNGRIRRVEHHLCHLASAFLVSPFDESAIASVDGFGDFASGAWGIGKGSSISVDNKVHFPHSLGIFYQAITQFIGFPHYGDEYKVMGLAPYGKPKFMKEMRQIVALEDDGSYKLQLDYFRHHRERTNYEWEDGIPTFGELFSNGLGELLGPARQSDEPLTQRHMDIAHSAQAMYEEAFFSLLDSLYQKHRLDTICLAGGCAMNSVANGKVYRRSNFKRSYIQSAAGDAGGAIGAALVAWHEGGEQRSASSAMTHAYYGPSFDTYEIDAAIAARKDDLLAEQCSVKTVDDESALCEESAQAISDGRVVGWFQGRMEWGPRALGNRSIVCDPRRADMKDILNKKIKRRESFRPFAPSVLRASVAEWFEEDDDVPFMMKVFQIRDEKRAHIPAVTHVDGSGRLQTVSDESNPRYFELITAFYKITGVPMVLNTSFNENEPVVCTPQEALDCFLRTKMDVLVMENRMISRN
jgi:carbamoyltransferase